MQDSRVPGPTGAVTVLQVQANGLTSGAAEAGAGDHLAPCPHGCPEPNHSWRHQVPLLARRDYRVWAPDRRRHAGSARPAGIESYAIDGIVADAAALSDASETLKLTLIGHDWGGAIAWFFAINRDRCS